MVGRTEMTAVIMWRLTPMDRNTVGGITYQCGMVFASVILQRYGMGMDKSDGLYSKDMDVQSRPTYSECS